MNKKVNYFNDYVPKQNFKRYQLAKKSQLDEYALGTMIKEECRCIMFCLANKKGLIFNKSLFLITEGTYLPLSINQIKEDLSKIKHYKYQDQFINIFNFWRRR